MPTFAQMTPAQQYQQMQREREAVPEQAIDRFLECCAAASRRIPPWQRVAAKIVGSGVHYTMRDDGGIDREFHGGFATREISEREMVALRGAIRAGDVVIQALQGTDLGDGPRVIATLHSPAGRFAPFGEDPPAPSSEPIPSLDGPR